MSIPAAKAALTGSGNVSSIGASSESESEELLALTHDARGQVLLEKSSSSSSSPAVSGNRPRLDRETLGVNGSALGWDDNRRCNRASDCISCSSGADSEMSVARRLAGMGRPEN